MLNSNSYRCTERAAPRAVTQQHSAKLHHYVQFSALLNERQQEEVTHTQTRRRRHLHTAARGQSSADMVDGMKCTLTPWNSTTPGNSITDYYHLFVFAKGKKTFLKLFIWRLVWSCSWTQRDDLRVASCCVRVKPESGTGSWDPSTVTDAVFAFCHPHANSSSSETKQTQTEASCFLFSVRFFLPEGNSVKNCTLTERICS